MDRGLRSPANAALKLHLTEADHPELHDDESMPKFSCRKASWLEKPCSAPGAVAGPLA